MIVFLSKLALVALEVFLAVINIIVNLINTLKSLNVVNLSTLLGLIRTNQNPSLFVVHCFSSNFRSHDILYWFWLSQIPKKNRSIPAGREKLLGIVVDCFYAENPTRVSMTKTVTFAVYLLSLLTLFIKNNNLTCLCS